MSASLPSGPLPRQQVIDALCEAFARDEMPLHEFERRVERAHREADPAELWRLLADLPSASVPAVGGGVAGASASRSGPVPTQGPVRPREIVAAILGGAGRSGRWTPARRTTAIATMGGVELDLREATLAGVTEVQAFAFWGAVEVLVPPGVRVECNGLGLMGGFEQGDDTGAAGVLGPDAPILRMTGVAIMGGVEVKVRFPGETARDAKRRLREERKRRKLQGGGAG